MNNSQYEKPNSKNCNLAILKRNGRVFLSFLYDDRRLGGFGYPKESYFFKSSQIYDIDSHS